MKTLKRILTAAKWVAIVAFVAAFAWLTPLGAWVVTEEIFDRDEE